MNRIRRHRLPNVALNELIEYPTPASLNYFWSFGFLAGLFLVIQIISGIILAMYYIPDSSLAFDSIEHLMRDVNYGWLLRYLHANGASLFFVTIYCHMTRGILIQGYLYPKHWVWMSGILLYILMIATAFLGYVLPWGQMSFWAATVITNIITALPFGDGGESLAIWLWGGFSVDSPTLNRFYSLHYLLPFLLLALVLLHLIFLHQDGSEPPLFHTNQVDAIRFYPYFFSKDLFGAIFFLLILGMFVFYSPNALGHPDNYIEANPLVTPEHIVPEWYFLPFYAMLRAIPNKFLGIFVMVGSLLLLLGMPLITYSRYRVTKYTVFSGFISWRFLKLYSMWTAVFLWDFSYLAHYGAVPVTAGTITVTLFLTYTYYIYFWGARLLYVWDKRYFEKWSTETS